MKLIQDLVKCRQLVSYFVNQRNSIWKFIIKNTISKTRRSAANELSAFSQNYDWAINPQLAHGKGGQLTPRPICSMSFWYHSELRSRLILIDWGSAKKCIIHISSSPSNMAATEPEIATRLRITCKNQCIFAYAITRNKTPAANPISSVLRYDRTRKKEITN